MASKAELRFAERLLDQFFRDSEGKAGHPLDIYFTVQSMDSTLERAEASLEYLASRGLLELPDFETALLTELGVKAVAEERDIKKMPRHQKVWKSSPPAAAAPAPAGPPVQDDTAPPSVAKRAPDPRPRSPQISYTDGSGISNTVTLGVRCTIGRADDNTITLDDRRASKNHIAIEFDNDHYVLVDLDSANGTVLNGEFVFRQRLEHRDEIVVGRTIIQYECPTKISPPPPEQSPQTPTQAAPPPNKPELVAPSVRADQKRSSRPEILAPSVRAVEDPTPVPTSPSAPPEAEKDRDAAPSRRASMPPPSVLAAREAEASAPSAPSDPDISDDNTKPPRGSQTDDGAPDGAALHVVKGDPVEDGAKEDLQVTNPTLKRPAARSEADLFVVQDAEPPIELVVRKDRTEDEAPIDLFSDGQEPAGAAGDDEGPADLFALSGPDPAAEADDDAGTPTVVPAPDSLPPDLDDGPTIASPELAAQLMAELQQAKAELETESKDDSTPSSDPHPSLEIIEVPPDDGPDDVDAGPSTPIDPASITPPPMSLDEDETALADASEMAPEPEVSDPHEDAAATSGEASPASEEDDEDADEPASEQDEGAADAPNPDFETRELGSEDVADLVKAMSGAMAPASPTREDGDGEGAQEPAATRVIDEPASLETRELGASDVADLVREMSAGMRPADHSEDAPPPDTQGSPVAEPTPDEGSEGEEDGDAPTPQERSSTSAAPVVEAMSEPSEPAQDDDDTQEDSGGGQGAYETRKLGEDDVAKLVSSMSDVDDEDTSEPTPPDAANDEQPDVPATQDVDRPAANLSPMDLADASVEDSVMGRPTMEFGFADIEEVASAAHAAGYSEDAERLAAQAATPGDNAFLRTLNELRDRVRDSDASDKILLLDAIRILSKSALIADLAKDIES